MTWNHPDDVPTDLTRRAYALRTPGISQNQYAAVVADAYADVVRDFLASVGARAQETGPLPEEIEVTPADRATADRLGLPQGFLSIVLMTWMQEAARIAKETQAQRKPPPLEARTLTRDNTDAIAAWVGGWRAGGAYELVGWGLRGSVQYARPGDTIVAVGDGKFEIRKKEQS